MKKALSSVAFLSVLMITSCSKKDDVQLISDEQTSVVGNDAPRGGGGTGGGSVFAGVIDMGDLPQNLFVFTNGSSDANWQGASKGFIGDVAIDGQQAKERTSGNVPFAGTITSSANPLGAWQSIVNSNSGQANAVHSPSSVNSLENSLENAFSEVNGLTVTPGFTGVSAQSLDNLNTQNGIGEVFVIDITSGFKVTTEINIKGDANDYFILRWDNDRNFSDGYDGQVKFEGGGAIVPEGALTPTNFLSVAGDISSSGGGTNPAAPYPQGPRYNNGTGSLIAGGSDFHGLTKPDIEVGIGLGNLAVPPELLDGIKARASQHQQTYRS